MKKKIICVSSVIVGILIILGSLSPAVCSKDIKNVTIEVNRYYGKNSGPIYTDVSIEEAEEIKQILINLNLAIENNDEVAISQYEKILNDKGIFGENHQKFFSNNQYNEVIKKINLVKYTKYFGSNADNISNTMCYFNAIAREGLMLWWVGLKLWQTIIDAIKNVTNPLAAFILLLTFLPFLVLILFFTALIPFRILAPSGLIALKNGTVSSLGLKGFKRLKVGPEGVDVNLSWFTGITINIPGSFLFVSGIAVGVKEGGT